MQALRVLDPGRPRPAQPAITSGLAPGTRPDSPPNGEETRKISAAKKGKPAIARGPNEATLQESVRETGFSAKVFRDGVKRQEQFERGESARRGLRHRRVLMPNGRPCTLFDRDERK